MVSIFISSFLEQENQKLDSHDIFTGILPFAFLHYQLYVSRRFD